MSETLTERELAIFTDGRNHGYERGYTAGIQAEKRRRVKIKADICALVEALRIAEQQRRAAEHVKDGGTAYANALHEYEVAVARLLEVNLG